MSLKYYKVGNSVVATTGKVDGVEITAEEYAAEQEATLARMEVNAKVWEMTRPRTIEEGAL